MYSVKENFIIDESGNKTAVVLSIEDYRHLLDELEELEEIKMYDMAKSKDDEVIPFDTAMKEIGLWVIIFL